MTRQEIFDHLIAAAREVSPGIRDLLADNSLDSIGADTCFVDLGINSIDYVEIVTIIMERLNIFIPVDEFACTNKVQEAVNILWCTLKG